jgi:hypothetical protein
MKSGAISDLIVAVILHNVYTSWVIWRRVNDWGVSGDSL